MSPPKKKLRNCICPLRGKGCHVFNPAGKPIDDLAIVLLEQDELEALYLCDGQDFKQEQAGEMMGVSRGTVQRLLAGARKKMIEVLVGQKALVIAGELPTVPTIEGGLSGDDKEGDVMAQEGSSCGSGGFGQCRGPHSCPWRRPDDGKCSREGMITA